MSDALVYQGDRLVAQINRTAAGSVMTFEPDVVADPPAFPGFLATSLPYSNFSVETRGDNLHPFFLNLLPEGARQQALFERRRMAKGDFLSLLLEVGQDTVGDVAVLRPADALDRRPRKTVDPSSVVFRQLLEEELYGSRSAVPGVQEKISDATISFPVATKNEAAILKLNPAKLPLLIQNEAFFLAMAADCGLRAAKAHLVTDAEGEPGLLVRRFDRAGGTKRVPLTKFHQEDGCQLLDTIPAHKYTEDYPSRPVRAIVTAARRVVTSTADLVKRIIQLYAFSYLIGNGDLHAKNISLLWRDGVVTLSPAYDLLSTLPYPGYGQRMALDLDGKDTGFRSREFIRFAEAFGVPAVTVRADLKKMNDRVSRWIPRLAEIGYDAKATEKLAREIERRRAALAT